MLQSRFSMRRPVLGKIPVDWLKKHVISSVGHKSSQIVLGSGIGLDFGVIHVPPGFLIVSSDPVTGVEEQIGHYAVNITANDVATCGHRPSFMETVILLPERADERYLQRIMKQIDETASKLKISIVGGHTEVTPGLDRPIIITTALAYVQKYVSSADAKDGDQIIMTKTAGLEGTSIIAHTLPNQELGVSSHMIRRAKNLIGQISIVDEAEAAFKTGAVHAMHDATEGGILGASYEMSLASNLGFTIYEKAVTVAGEVLKICTSLRIDPLKLIASGSLLLAVPRGQVSKVVGVINSLNVEAAVIGKFGGSQRRLVRRNGNTEILRDDIQDEIWRIVS
jgi:hydrogenase maturation factor